MNESINLSLIKKAFDNYLDEIYDSHPADKAREWNLFKKELLKLAKERAAKYSKGKS